MQQRGRGVRGFVASVLLLAGPFACGGDCKSLQNGIEGAVGGFTPHSSNTCSSASDCTIVNNTVSRNAVCLQGCGQATTKARAAEWKTFLANDPNVTAACNAFLDSGCDLGLPLECPCVGAGTPTGCGSLRCVEGGVCQ